MNKEILRLAIPNIVSNITIPLLNLLDLALMGNWGSEHHIGAISIGGMIFNFLFWAFAFLRMGTSGFTAQAFGEKNQEEQAHLFFRSVITGFLSGIILILLQWPIGKIAFGLINGSQTVETLASGYFRIRIWSSPATIALFAFTGWFIGMQNSSIPMLVALIINITNISLNLLFIFKLGMKTEGIALGATIAQYVGLILSIGFVYFKYQWVRRYFQLKDILNLAKLKGFFLVNIDIFIRTSCIIAVFTLFTSKSAGINDTTLAANSLLLQFLLFFSFFIDGFAYAGEALTGRYIGEKNKKMVIKLIKKLFTWGAVLALMFSIVYILFAERIIMLLSASQNVLTQAKPYLGWVIALPIISFISYIWDGIYVGATASKGMRNALLISTLGLFLPVYLFLFPILGNHAIWLSLTLFMIGRGLFQSLMAKRQIGEKLR
ncbi:MAG: MATE family efflux transporter [Bacteroidota bacterium]|nr:MATE family efflux transporter [Bacteroidota bacterium]